MTRTLRSPRSPSHRLVAVLAAAGITVLSAACGDDGSDVPTPASVDAPAASDGSAPPSDDAADVGDPSGGTVDTNPLSTGNTPQNSAEGTVP